MEIRKGLSKRDVPDVATQSVKVAKRGILLDFLESCDEAWEIIPENENGQSLYNAFRSSIQNEPTLRYNCFAIKRGDRIFLVRAR